MPSIAGKISSRLWSYLGIEVDDALEISDSIEV